MSNGAYLYIVRCADGAYYTGITRTDLETRIAQHNAGTFDGWTARRRPVVLVYSEWFDRILDAIAAERQVKGWSRAKKEALIRGDFDALRALSHRGRLSFETGARSQAYAGCACYGPPQDEAE